MAAQSEEAGLAARREQRRNAGNKMSKLLADELDEDDFYKTALGGFQDESGDEEYESEDDMSDQVDSDFSMSETDEVIQEDEEDEGKRKRKKAFYKEPKRVKVGEKDNETIPKVPTQTPKPVKNYPQALSSAERRKSSRALTVESSEMHRKRMAKKPKGSKKQVKFPQLRHLTQEELLAEAKITEELNIESLKAYRLMEETKKKSKNIKVVRKEPMVRYLSVTMPLVEDEINIEDDGDKGTSKDKTRVLEGSKCSRNFIIFTDPKTYPGSYFSSKKVQLPQKSYCPVTGLPAKYVDPVTKMPYATVQAFRYIRQHFAKQGNEAAEKQEKRTRSSRKVSQNTMV